MRYLLWTLLSIVGAIDVACVDRGGSSSISIVEVNGLMCAVEGDTYSHAVWAKGDFQDEIHQTGWGILTIVANRVRICIYKVLA